MDINIRQCVRCNKLFRPLSSSFLCPECLNESEKKFSEVRSFIYDNPNASMDDICDAINVERDDVIRWIREGRLILASESPVALKCERCGKPIKQGRYCDDCTKEIRSELEAGARAIKGSAQDKPKTKSYEDRRGGLYLNISSKKD